MEIGDRVGAILSIDDDGQVIEFLGYGVYEGTFPVEGLRSAIRDMTGEEPEEEDILNPRVKLDSGDTVWGYQMWWAPEDEMRADIERLKSVGFTVKLAHLDTDAYL